ncbi:hypothetical protein ACLQ2S_21320 [Micromonospora sp. DT48]|uniref:hypothetical protein n=1 Tax=unclassified Micromonospora TaxID=2617518 RepID=UPI0012BC0BC7|nr:hypothetical protein [Micromonospora sp. CP22]MTK04829.1 hypothetical protein [Micromonospora sp. CP22]
MLPVAASRPLWWLARWAARLLAGFVVAAAFTLGTWALPGEVTPVDRLAAAPPPLVQAAAPSTCTCPDLAADLDLVGLETEAVRDSGDVTDLTGASAAQPATASGRPGLAALGGVAAPVTPEPITRAVDVRVARAPPHA